MQLARALKGLPIFDWLCQTVSDDPPGGRIHANADMAGQNLNVFNVGVMFLFRLDAALHLFIYFAASGHFIDSPGIGASW